LQPAKPVKKSLDPLEFLSQFEHEGPIDMVNQFKFREQANYPDNREEPERTGMEAFSIYAQQLTPILEDCGGCIRLWEGEVHFDITGNGSDTWDLMMVVRYPSRKALMKLFSHPGFAKIHHHRQAALTDSRTYICTSRSS
jgi:uncharacterized protein (DUF1330 family)